MPVKSNYALVNQPLTFTLSLNKTRELEPRTDFLPDDVEDVIIKDNLVIVNLTNGKKGIAEQGKDDVFDPFVGFCIAYYKAKYSKSYRLKEALAGCDKVARNKGYRQGILKNY